MFDLVRATTKDTLHLHGLYVEGDKNKPVILHIHGFEGDFFTNDFIKPLAKKLKETNYAFLTAQTRGMSSDTLFHTSENTWRRYGSHFELHEEAYLDIDAWIEFLRIQGYTNIILQGHSLGTFKVLRYLFEGTYPEMVSKIILLAPFDNIYMAESYTKGKWRNFLQQAKQKITDGKGDEIMPKDWWDTELSYKTFVTWLDDNDSTHIFDFYDNAYTFPLLNKIEIPVKMIVGSKDAFFHSSNPSNPHEAIDMMKKNIKKFDPTLIENATHGYEGYENILVEKIIKFLHLKI
ncbi:hypothetical protein BH09PAT2_BH09PAT2_05410 [soil metagenome]